MQRNMDGPKTARAHELHGAIPFLGHGILREIRITWLFIRHNFGSTVIPGVLFSSAALRHYQHDVRTWLLRLILSLAYFFFYGYTFDLSNQLAGSVEDELNKPDRPLAAKLVRITTTWYRWDIAMGLFTLLGWWLNVLPWTLLWQVTLIWHNQGRGAKWWGTKCLAMSLGIVAQLAAAWEMIGPLTSMSWRWILFLGISNFWIVNIQDLRDQAGDRRESRRTFVLLYGEQRTRALLTVSFAIMTSITTIFCFLPLSFSPAMLVLCLLTNSLLLVVAGRIWWYRSPGGDHRSYQLYIYWYCLLLASAIVLL